MASCTRRSRNNELALTKSASTRVCSRLANAVSISPLVLAARTSICQPMAKAASRASLVYGSAVGSLGLTSTANRAARGSKSRTSPSRLAASSELKVVMPVMLPPGRLRLATRPCATGSPPVLKTIGIVVVAALAANTALPKVEITATRRRTRSADNSGSRS